MITTFTGRSVDLLNMDERTISSADIGHALALLNRFVGHSREPISIAQHSVYVSLLVDGTGCELQGLLHDASEAYLGDVSKWLKHTPTMAPYRAIEQAVQSMIYRKYGCPEEDSQAVKDADWLMVRYEGEMGLPGWGMHCRTMRDRHGKSNLTPVNSKEYAQLKRLPAWQPWSWQRAERKFLERFDRLLERAARA